MSYRNNEDWDLCWYYSSSTGCKKENCTWRHEKSADRSSQNLYKKSRGLRRYNRADSRRTPVLPFYSMKQYRNGGSDERYDSLYYPELGNVHSPGVNSRLIRKDRYQHGTENFLSGQNPMSESSPGFESTTSSASSVKSRGESDPECEEIKNAEVVPGKVMNQKSLSFIILEKALGESETQKQLLKVKMNREKKNCQCPFPIC